MQGSEQAPRSLKEKQRQEREELILQAAEEVLAEKGYHEASMDEIARRVGIAKGTVYLHFPSKEDLVVAICTRDMRQFLREVDVVIAEQPTVRARLEAVLHFMYTGLFNKRAQLFYSMYSNTELRRAFVEKQEYVRDLWDQVASRIRALLEEGKVNGELNASIPTGVMLGAFFSLLMPKMYERMLAGEQLSPDELAKSIGHIYFHGIESSVKQ